jgi:glycosyltransferase involved in cell wall biosynthesis
LTKSVQHGRDRIVWEVKEKIASDSHGAEAILVVKGGLAARDLHQMDRTVAFVWENFGPLHVDRCESVARRGFEVIGIEFGSRSNTYDWLPTQTGFQKVTLFRNRIGTDVSELSLFRKLLGACYRSGAKHIFFCHHIHPAVFFSAIAMRGLGRYVHTMIESKFDDFPRCFGREFAKRQLLAPYHGCLAAGTRTQDYVRFLGIPPDRIAPGYDTISIRRMREGAGNSPTVPFDERHFTIVARLVPKKNHKMALDAYSRYVSRSPNPRRLVICGSGPLEAELKAQVKSLSLESLVTFTGFVQTAEVARCLHSTLALILPSVEEQFGQVILEALAMEVPVLVSEACGARDELVRTGVNGFVFEPDNPEGLAWFMSLLSTEERLWRKMADSTQRFLPLSDVERFAEGVERLTSI